MSFPYHPDDCIVATATPRGRGALAVLRSSGKRCIETFSSLFSQPEALRASTGNRIHYGWIIDEKDRRIDEVLVSVFRAPASYTGQDSIEVSCHGGTAVVDKIMELFRNNGFRDASPGEFTFRAVLSGKMELTKAEAVKEIIDARTEKAREQAVSRLSGSVEAIVNDAKSIIKHQAAIVSLVLDYPEEEIGSVSFDNASIRRVRLLLEKLIGTWKTGKIYRDGLRVALAGPANAGKSSLFNLFLKEERSIVTDKPGTTRDWVEAWISLNGIPLCLIDTAGLRASSGDPIEQEGIRRTRELIISSDIILAIVDGTEGKEVARMFYAKELEEKDKTLTEEEFQNKVICIWNKADMAPGIPQGWLGLSALDGTGFVELENAIYAKILERGISTEGNFPVIYSARQCRLLKEATSALQRFEVEDGFSLDIKAEDLRDALNALGELTGEVSRSDVLNLVFSEFCVGK